MGRISHCLSDLRQVAAGCKDSADHPAGSGLRWRNSPPLGGHGNPGLLQPSLRISAPGLHRVVSNWKSELEALCHTLTYDKTLSQQVPNNDVTIQESMRLCVCSSARQDITTSVKIINSFWQIRVQGNIFRSVVLVDLKSSLHKYI